MTKKSLSNTAGTPEGPSRDNSNPEPPRPNHLAGNLRRVVIGNNDDLQGSIVRETFIPFKTTGYWGMSQASIWQTSETPSDDTNATSDFDGASRVGDRMGGFVSSMGTNFFIQDFAPGAEVPMHVSHTVDYFLMMSGTMISINEEGEECKVTAGDVVVRRGNMHGWRNPGPEWARWAAVILDAEPAVRNGKSLAEGMKQAAEL